MLMTIIIGGSVALVATALYRRLAFAPHHVYPLTDRLDRLHRAVYARERRRR